VLPPLLLVTDRHGTDRPLAETVRAAVAGGARFVWLRDRELDAEARRALARHLVVGGDPDLATEVGAQGVHLPGSAGIDGIRALREKLGAAALIGFSAHSVAEIAAAEAAGADYATLSPIFPSASKPGYGPALGLEALRAACFASGTMPAPAARRGRRASP
jgi:thiamine-phosphate pyrophosphorylase